MLVSRRPLHAEEELVRFAEDRNFDWVYRDDMRPEWSNRFYIFDAPYHSLAVERLSEAYREGRETAFFNAYFMDIRPQTDNRPFPNRFLKWQRLKETYRATGSRMYTLLLSGEIVVAVIFIEAGLLSLVLMALPFLVLRKTSSRPGAAEMIYFLSLGIGFMFVELYFIKQFVLLYGDPVVSFTVVLTGMLVFSGVGGFFSQRLTESALVVSLFLLVILLALSGTGHHVVDASDSPFSSRDARCDRPGLAGGSGRADRTPLPAGHAPSAANSVIPGLCLDGQRLCIGAGIDRRGPAGLEPGHRRYRHRCCGSVWHRIDLRAQNALIDCG